jgi:hypothetical protein
LTLSWAPLTTKTCPSIKLFSAEAIEMTHSIVNATRIFGIDWGIIRGTAYHLVVASGSTKAFQRDVVSSGEPWLASRCFAMVNALTLTPFQTT